MDDQDQTPLVTKAHPFSLETRDPNYGYKRNHRVLIIALFRIALWLSPGPLFVLFGLLLNAQSFIPKTAPWIILGILSTIGLGYFDACLSENIKKENGIPKTADAVKHTIFFLLIQPFVAPLSFILLMVFMLTIGVLDSLL